MNRPFILSLVALSSLLSSGCAHYEYDLVNPPDLARHIGTTADAVVQVDPLEYRLRTYENRLVMSVVNPTPDPITLAGDRSYVVDPAGQSHPLRIQTIAPDTYIRLIFPPMRPGYYQSSPSIGIGFGVSYNHYHGGAGGGGHRYGYGAFGYDPFFYDQPQYYTYYDESDNTYWNWEGESAVRMHLVYFRAGSREPFMQDFTFARKKM
jgi:hypothetical protein